MYYVYIIESITTGIFYKESTSDFIRRLEEHNSNKNLYTRNKGTWKLIFVQEFATLQEALRVEKKLKRCNKKYLQWLILQPVNILNKQ